VPIDLKSGNLLKPSGPVQAYNGIALPLPFINVMMLYSVKLSATPTTHRWEDNIKINIKEVG